MRQTNLFRFWTLFMFALGLLGCSFAPDVPSSKSDPINDRWPYLLTGAQLSSLTEGLDKRPSKVDEENQTLVERSATLRAQAAGLRASVLTDAERKRLTEATATP